MKKQKKEIKTDKNRLVLFCICFFYKKEEKYEL